MMLNHYEDFSPTFSEMRDLPPEHPPEKAKDCESKKINLNRRKPSVLIFGSNTEVRLLLKTILELWDYETTEVETVEQAFRCSEKKRFDLVVMDMRLSYPESFFEMRQMQKSNSMKNLPFIMLSGHIQQDVRLMAFAAGATDFFSKPVNLDLFEETLKIHLAGDERMERSEDFQTR